MKIVRDISTAFLCLLLFLGNSVIWLILRGRELTLSGPYIHFKIELCLLGALLVIMLVNMIVQRGSFWGKGWFWGVAVTLITVKLLFFLLHGSFGFERHYSVPYSKETLILGNELWFEPGKVGVYQKVGKLFKKSVSGAPITVSPGHSPFYDDGYRIDWGYDGEVKIEYSGGYCCCSIEEFTFSFADVEEREGESLAEQAIPLEESYSVKGHGLTVDVKLKEYRGGRIFAELLLKNELGKKSVFDSKNISFNYNKGKSRAVLNSFDIYTKKRGKITVDTGDILSYTISFAYDNSSEPIEQLDLKQCNVLYTEERK